MVTLLTILTADPVSPADLTGWLLFTSGSPNTVSLRVRIGGVTYTLAAMDVP